MDRFTALHVTWCPAAGMRAGAGEGTSIAETNDREDHIMETLRAAATQGRLFLQTHTSQINNLVSVATKQKQESTCVINIFNDHFT